MTTYQYLAKWIGRAEEMNDVAVRLNSLYLQPLYKTSDMFGYADLSYTFIATEDQMIAWRQCLKNMEIEPFYVHEEKVIA